MPQIELTIPSREPWLSSSPFNVRIEATYGSFGTVISEPQLEITVKEPCFETVIASQFILQMTTFLNSPLPRSRIIDQFKNSIDTEYRESTGATSDLCGDQEYAIFELIGDQ